MSYATLERLVAFQLARLLGLLDTDMASPPCLIMFLTANCLYFLYDLDPDICDAVIDYGTSSATLDASDPGAQLLLE